MGADIYMAGFSEYSEQFQPAFQEAAAARDRAHEEGDKAKADKLQEEVSKLYDKMYGDNPYYFRDSYNCTSILWQLGLSWWSDIGDRLNEEGELEEEGIRWLLEQVQDGEIPPAEELRLDNAADADTPEGLQSWREFFVKKQQSLIEFLQRALDEGKVLECSI